MVMVSPGQFSKTLADALAMPLTTVEQYDRGLMEAKLRTKGGRGTSAAKLTARDAANLLTAILGSDKVVDGAAIVKRYAATRPYKPLSAKKGFSEAGLIELTRLPADHSFIDALEALIASGMDGSLSEWLGGKPDRRSKRPRLPLFEIAATSPGVVGDIRIAGIVEGATGHIRYMTPGPSMDLKHIATNLPYEAVSGLTQHRMVTAQPIVQIAGVLAGRGQ